MATTIGDIVLVHFEDAPVFFARIEDIKPDHKPEWWQVHMLILMPPGEEIVWTLREQYINGEVFTMGGQERFLKKLHPPRGLADAPEPLKQEKEVQTDDAAPEGKVVSLFDRKK